MIEFPSIRPMESTTLAPESALFAAELAERISLALRAIATGMHVKRVDLAEAVQELGAVWDEARDLESLVCDLQRDGRDQLAAERAVRFGIAGVSDDPWDPAYVEPVESTPLVGHAHRNLDTSPEPSRSDAEFGADRAARVQEAFQLGWDR